MERKQQLFSIFEKVDKQIRVVIDPMIDEVIFLEKKLCELKKLPFINIHPSNPTRQKATPAAKQYKEILQQYNSCVKILCSVLAKNGEDDESPLRAWVKSRKDEENTT